MRRAVKWLALRIHELAAKDSRIASLYLGLFRLLKYLPDGRWKQQVLNSLGSIRWPVIGLRPARVQIGASITISLVPHPEEFDFAAHIFRRLRYEQEVMSWLQGRKYEIVIEIGANVGIYTLFFSRQWPGARVYSFEPSGKAYLRLMENLTLNDCGNVRAFNCAVAAQTGLLDFYEPEGHLTNGSLDQSFARIFAGSVRSTKVPGISGTQIAQLLPKGKRVLFKIDVEGSEPTVLGSLEQIIRSERPDILIEVLEPTVDALNRIRWLSGYRYYQLEADGPHERDIFTAGKSRDYALVPSTAEATTA